MNNDTEERTETHACDLISRQAAITAIQKTYADTEGGADKCAVWKNVGLTNALHIMQDLPSAQPEPHYDEWCDDCKEYDKERHCCPRWNRVIRQTLKDAQPEQKWIPVTESTLPEKGMVVIAKGERGTWDFGTYRGHGDDIHFWHWKKNTFKRVYWWMYKDNALPEPYREDEEN